MKKLCIKLLYIRPVLHSCKGKAEVKTISCFRRKFAKRWNPPSCLSARSPHVFNSNTFFIDCCEIPVSHKQQDTYFLCVFYQARWEVQSMLLKDDSTPVLREICVFFYGLKIGKKRRSKTAQSKDKHV